MTQNYTLSGGASENVILTSKEGKSFRHKTDIPDNRISLYFDIITEHSVSIQNQITDNYIENNTAIQDQIAHSPLVVSLSGLIGEVVYIPPAKALDWLYKKTNLKIQDFANQNVMANNNLLTDKLLAIPALLPPADNITQAAKNTVQYVESSVNRYIKIFKSFGEDDLGKMTRLESVYDSLKKMRDYNDLLIVETPYTVFDNMVILSVTLRQGNENYTSDIQLTLKQINFAQTYTTQPDTSVMAKYNAIPRTTEANHGKAQGVSNDSFIGSAIYKYTGLEPARYKG